MNIKISAVLLIALMVSLPLIQAQEEVVIPEGVVTDEVIPEDIAEVLVGVGSGPAIPFILDIIIAPILDIFFTIVAIVFDIFDTCCLAYGVDFLDTFVAWGTDVIDTILAGVAACWAKGLGAWLSPIAACCALPFGICPLDTWVMTCCNYCPVLACIPHTWSLVKSCCTLLGIF